MDKIVPTLAIVAVLAGVYFLMYRGWRARKSRHTSFAPLPQKPQGDTKQQALLLEAKLLYVATTFAGKPLERLALPGLAFRGLATLHIGSAGISLSVTAEPEIFIAAENIHSIGRSTWAIDRVVEPGGLLRLEWFASSLDGSLIAVESYFRATDGSLAQQIIAAVDSLHNKAQAGAFK